MIVHVMPSFLCNWNCSYCYLGALKQDKTQLSLNALASRLTDISSHAMIDTINIYGGEITLLDDNYLKSLFTLCSWHTKDVACVTNNPVAPQIDLYPWISWSSSLNKERDNYTATLQSLFLRENKITTLTQVVTPSLLKEDPKYILERIDTLCESVTFLRYSPSRVNPLWKISNKAYEDFIISMLDEYKNSSYDFVLANAQELEDCINRKYDPTIQSNIFIMPNGNFAIVAYDKNHHEYFKELGSWHDYQEEIEKEASFYEKQCSNCKYYGRCYAEHITKHQTDDICCGGYKLLEYYENIYKNDREL